MLETGMAMNNTITYKDAGVDVELADKAIQSLSTRIRATFRPEVIGRMGGFAAMFRPNWRNYRDPVLVSAADGVGTKLKIAFRTGIHDTVGIDLVAMNVNDLVVTGAEPLFFLDYFATGKLEPDVFRSVVSGIADGCEQAGCSLIGGETAEMPDFYPPGEYDLAGFCVGIADGHRIIEGSAIRHGDVLIGLASTGLHSNGFSLVRKVLLDEKRMTLDNHIDELGRTLGEELLTPTAIYVRPVLNLMERVQVLGTAHITGGGFIGNIPRILPEHVSVVIRRDAWDVPPIFGLLKREAGLDDAEMFRTFNMGIGMVIIVRATEADAAVEFLNECGTRAFPIGETTTLESRAGGVDIV
ncbi:MAG: phosphoribosylformylglycinamidine cyclo-ligase [Pseudomonadota bacterium]